MGDYNLKPAPGGLLKVRFFLLQESATESGLGLLRASTNWNFHYQRLTMRRRSEAFKFKWTFGEKEECAMQWHL